MASEGAHGHGAWVAGARRAAGCVRCPLRPLRQLRPRVALDEWLERQKAVTKGYARGEGVMGYNIQPDC